LLPVKLEYKDANNNDFDEIINLKLNLFSASEAKKFGLVNGNGFMGIFIHSVPALFTGHKLWIYRFFCLSFSFSLSTTAILFIFPYFFTTFINIKILLTYGINSFPLNLLQGEKVARPNL